jgi:hypothetical protein
MIFIPREKVILENLNSYYLDIRRLLEHHQGEIGAGAAHFVSPALEGAIFFDKDDLLSGIMEDRAGRQTGPDVIDHLIGAAEDHNFRITVFQIETEKIYFWANLPYAETVYRNLSTEFTDLERLIKKMRMERLTGHIDIDISGGDEIGCIFFYTGSIVGSFFSTEGVGSSDSRQSLATLVGKSKRDGAVFTVRRITTSKPAPPAPAASGQPMQRPERSATALLEELLSSCDGALADARKRNARFETLLRRKFIDNVERFPFLDPFAADFQYAGGRLTYTGDSPHRELLRGVVTSLRELFAEQEMQTQFNTVFSDWLERHETELASFGLKK